MKRFVCRSHQKTNKLLARPGRSDCHSLRGILSCSGLKWDEPSSIIGAAGKDSSKSVELALKRENYLVLPYMP
ncbi:unnamed protein product [Protopolystoma xenopodis]|uniref:Uncharacterized protein n=1 Tax=Protopolystoma xenopodis TaxID=117903 RepID=A0A448WR21_9PLAT|nr:unnamed protein product [Protopolystoma xenopodis]